MRIKIWIAAILTLLVMSVGATSTAPLPGKRYELARKSFRVGESNPQEPYVELVEPLDKWTKEALKTGHHVYVRENHWNQCQIIRSNATTFRFKQRFYNLTYLSATRTVRIHVDPLREWSSSIYVSLSEVANATKELYYELHDPLDPWTAAALEDMINMVVVDNLYLDECALLNTPNSLDDWEHRPIFKYGDKFYTLDWFAFADNFGFRVPFKEIITIAWIALGLLWLRQAHSPGADRTQPRRRQA